MASQQDIDKNHIWHPYSAMHSELPVYEVESAHGVRLRLTDGRELIDGMASWWCMIHGYNHPRLNKAIKTQLDKVAHVMFGGLTHEPAICLTEKLIEITPPGLEAVFYSDSGSVAVEVAMKMAIQYWQARGKPAKQRFIALQGGYHGDTLGAMSVCDPVTGMHSLFNNVLAQQVFIERPESRFTEACSDDDLNRLERTIVEHADTCAALILEPIVQGAGGMWFYSADYLKKARELCTKHKVLLIADEIATGFGRTGKLFACEHAHISPDIMCIGKALTGGYLTLAATLTTTKIANAIDAGSPGVFMHGPTFMANPLACSVANHSIELLLSDRFEENIQRINQVLSELLEPAKLLDSVNEVRILGAIGVIEMHDAVDMGTITQQFIAEGVWLRPFGKLVYLMPPYVINNTDLKTLCNSLLTVLSKL